MNTIQRFEFGDALNKALSLIGPSRLDVDQVVVPTISMFDLTDSPHLRYGRLGARHANSTVTAAEFSQVGVQPGDGVALQVMQLVITETAGVASSYIVNVSPRSVIAGWNTPGTPAQLVDGYVDGESTVAVLASRIIEGSAAANNGASLFRVSLAANECKVIDLPKPGIIILGRGVRGTTGAADLDAHHALVVSALTANRGFNAGFVCREWPIA